MKNLKRILVVLAVIVSAGNVMAQSKKELELENENLRLQLELMKMKANQSNNAQQQQSIQQPENASIDGRIVQKLSRLQELQFKDPRKLRAVGESSDEDAQDARNFAELEARAQLQRTIENMIKDALDRYSRKTQMNGAKNKQSKKEQITTLVSKRINNGCKIIDYEKYYNPSTEEYTYEVLVEYDKQGVIGLIEEQDQTIMRNRAEFAKTMQEVFDEYEMEKTGSTYSMRKAAEENAMQQDNLDRQANRDAQVRQQEADNAYRKMESQQNYKLKSQQQLNNVVKDLQEKNIDYEIINGTNNNR